MQRDAYTLLTEYVELSNTVKPHLDRMDEIKTLLSKILPGSGRSTSDIADVTLSENVTYPFTKSKLTDGQKKRVMKSVVDTKKWASLYPEDHAASKTFGEADYKVGIKIH